MTRSVAAGLSSAVNADTNLQSISVSSFSFGTDFYVASSSANNTSYSTSTSGGATETFTLGANFNSSTNVMVVGSATAGDVVTITVHDPALSGGFESASYTVQPGDALVNILLALESAVNSDSALAALGVTFYGALASSSTNVTTYTQSFSSGATESVVFSLNTNFNENVLVGGTTTAGDVVTLRVYDDTLSGGTVSDSYTVSSGDDTTAIATGLANAINSDSSVNYVVYAANFGPNIILITYSQNTTSYRSSTNSAATETVLLSKNAIGRTFGIFGSNQFHYNNDNELVQVTSGGATQIDSTTSKPIKEGAVASNTLSILQTASNTTYGVPQYSSASETISVGQQQNGSSNLTVGGTATVGDVLSVIVFNSSLMGGQKQIFYTVLSGDTVSSIPSSLASAINADTDVAALGITATSIGQFVILSQIGTTYTSATSSGATETLDLGFNNSGNIIVGVGGSVTAGDTVTVTAVNAALAGGQEDATYTVLSGDTIVSIAAGLAAAINTDTNLVNIGLTANSSSPATLSWSQAFSANTTLTPYENDTVISATDGNSSTASTNYELYTPPTTADTSLTYDLNGNMTNDGTNDYSWDAENRLIKITYPGTNNFSSFVYDGYGRNVSIVETTAGSVTSTKQFVWAGSNRREERDASGGLTKRFFGRGQMNLTTKYFYDRDHLGSVREMTDNSGVVQAQYAFDPFGRVSKISEVVAADFGYAGYYLHSRSGLNLTRTRAYNSALGRFTTRDPIEENGGVNLFAYVSNAPIRQNDPSGHQCICQTNPPLKGNVTQTEGEAPSGQGPQPTRMNTTAPPLVPMVSPQGVPPDSSGQANVTTPSGQPLSIPLAPSSPLSGVQIAPDPNPFTGPGSCQQTATPRGNLGNQDYSQTPQQ